MTRQSEQSVGDHLVSAIAAQDRDAIAACFTPVAQLRALTPKGLREREGAEEIGALIASWYADSVVDGRFERAELLCSGFRPRLQ